MKRIGIIGGLGPEATSDYYNRIIDAFKKKDTSLNYPEIIIYSVNLAKLTGFMNKKEYNKAADYIAGGLEALKLAGADFGAISANTPHMLFREITKRSTLPLISIVEATLRRALEMGLKKTGLFGTKFTMDAAFYADPFAREGIEVVSPIEKEKILLHEKLFQEIELGIFKDTTRELLIEIIQKMIGRDNIDSLILGCTEFPLILGEESYAGIPVLNTTQIHVNAIINECLQ